MILAWVFLSFVVAFIGNDRKIGYWGTFGLSLLLTPIIGAVFDLASQRKTNNGNKELPPIGYEYYNQARKAYRKGNIGLALHFLDNAYKISAYSSLISYSLAICYSANKDPALAYNHLKINAQPR